MIASRAATAALLVSAGCAVPPPVVTVPVAPSGGEEVSPGAPAAPARAGVRHARRAVWARRMLGSGPQEIGGIAVDAAGNVAITGRFRGTAELGAGSLPNPTPGQEGLFVALLDDRGRTRWSRAFGGLHERDLPLVAFDPEGGVVIAGTFSTAALDLGLGPLRRVGASDLFVARLDPSGRTIWAQRFGGPDLQTMTGLAVDPRGNVVIGGHFGGAGPDFGKGPLAGAGGPDVFVAKLDPRGRARWSLWFGSSDTDELTGVGVDGEGNVVLAGVFHDTIDFGLGPLLTAGGADIFVAKLRPDASPVYSRRFGGTLMDAVWALGVDASGDVALTGPVWGDMDYDPRVTDPRGRGYVGVLDAAGRLRWAERTEGWTTEPPVFDGAGGLLVAGVHRMIHAPWVTDFTEKGRDAWSARIGKGVGQRLAAAVDRRNRTFLLAGVAVDDAVDLGTGPLPGAANRIVVVALSP